MPENNLVENHDRTSAVVVAGNNLNSNFWKSFIALCNNNPDGLAAILNTSQSKVGTWAGKITQALSEHPPEPEPSNRKILVNGEKMKSIKEWKALKLLEKVEGEFNEASFNPNRFLQSSGMSSGVSIDTAIRTLLTRVFHKVVPVLQRTLSNEEILTQVTADLAQVLANPETKVMPSHLTGSDLRKNLSAL